VGEVSRFSYTAAVTQHGVGAAVERGGPAEFNQGLFAFAARDSGQFELTVVVRRLGIGAGTASGQQRCQSEQQTDGLQSHKTSRRAVLHVWRLGSQRLTRA